MGTSIEFGIWMCTDKHQQHDRYSSAAGMTASSSNASSSSNRASFASFPGVRTCESSDCHRLGQDLMQTHHLITPYADSASCHTHAHHLITHMLTSSSHTLSHTQPRSKGARRRMLGIDHIEECCSGRRARDASRGSGLLLSLYHR